MTDDLHALETWAGALLAKLQPEQRRLVNRKVAQELRRSQSQRIAAQRQPDGASYTPRKARKDLRGKQGRIKRQSQKMFNKLRTAQNLKIESDDNQLAVGFFGRVARIARVHQEGLTDRVARNGPEYHYPARVLLGFTEAERELIRDSLLRHLTV
jgi:phage virion morphogenesis protein